MIELIIGFIVLCFLGYIGFQYLEGAYSINSVEEVSKHTYTLYKHVLGQSFEQGKETNIVQKITYENGRVKYKTITYKH